MRIILFLLLFISPSFASEKAALVIGVEGNVNVVREGNKLPLTKKEILYNKDQILTSEESSIELQMIDGSLINLGELSDLFIEELVYDPIKKDGFMDIEIAVGAFRMVSGTIAKLGPDLMQVKLPRATIGIRGTGLIGKVEEDGDSYVIMVRDPEGKIGELIIQNTVGVVVLTKLNEGVTIIRSDEKLTKKKYTKEFVLDLIKQVPKISKIPLHQRQFESLFMFKP